MCEFVSPPFLEAGKVRARARLQAVVDDVEQDQEADEEGRADREREGQVDREGGLVQHVVVAACAGARASRVSCGRGVAAVAWGAVRSHAVTRQDSTGVSHSNCMLASACVWSAVSAVLPGRRSMRSATCPSSRRQPGRLSMHGPDPDAQPYAPSRTVQQERVVQAVALQQLQREVVVEDRPGEQARRPDHERHHRARQPRQAQRHVQRQRKAQEVERQRHVGPCARAPRGSPPVPLARFERRARRPARLHTPAAGGGSRAAAASDTRPLAFGVSARRSARCLRRRGRARAHRACPQSSGWRSSRG